MTTARPLCARCFGRDYGTVGLHIVEDGTPAGEAACGYHARQALEYGKTLRAGLAGDERDPITGELIAAYPTEVH